MKANSQKCHLLVTGNYKLILIKIDINKFEIESSKK